MKMRSKVFQKLAEVKDLLRQRCKIKNEDFDKLISRIGNWYYRKDFPLTNQEQKVLEVLLSHKYNPHTVYRWSLIVKVPEEIKSKLRLGLIGQKKASRQKQYFKNLYSSDEQNIHRAVIDLVERYIVR